MILESNETAEAIFFFGSDGNITKEMSYTEFEAVLDGYAPLTDIKNTAVKAVYLSINNNFMVRSAVFFKITMTETGEIEKSWRLPLAHISIMAAHGPNLGAGPIRLACYSQSLIEHLQNSLWDPDMTSTDNQFSQIKKSVALNKIGFLFREPKPHANEATHSRDTSTNTAHIYAVIDKSKIEQEINLRTRKACVEEYKIQIEDILTKQRLKTATLKHDHDKQLQEIKREYAQRIAHYSDKVNELQEHIKQANRQNEELKNTINGQAEKISGLREYFEHKIAIMEGQELDELQEQRNGFELEVASRIEAAITEYKEILQLREIELFMRNKQEAQLHDEINRLRKENQEALKNNTDHYLLNMIEKGVSLVTYQPGAGHLTLPLSGLEKYMQNPIAYIAEYCGVSESVYNAWLQHHQMPVCSAQSNTGEICGEDIPRIESPTDFHINECDRCAKHKPQHNRPHLRLASE